MSTRHVTLKVVGCSDIGLQRHIRMRSRPTGGASEPWACGTCFSYATKHDTYRLISKTCSDHSCLIPKD